MLERMNFDFDFDFKTDWTNIETKGVKQIINEFFEENYFVANAVDEFGLAYTSHSMCAMLGACSGRRFEIEDGIFLSFFAIHGQERIIAVGVDKEGNHHHYDLMGVIW